jgi:hypothetical protein
MTDPRSLTDVWLHVEPPSFTLREEIADEDDEDEDEEDDEDEGDDDDDNDELEDDGAGYSE